MAIVDYFLKLDGIPGDAADEKHKDEIRIERFFFSMKSPRDLATGQATGRRQYTPLVFQARVNKASPKILMACVTNQVIKKASFVARRPGGKAEEYFFITLTNATVCKYETTGGADLSGMAAGEGMGETSRSQAGEGSMVIPLDRFEMTFASIEVKFVPYGADHKPGGPVTVSDDWHTGAHS